MQKPRFGIFGGSGLYKLLDSAREKEVKTPYGPPADKVVLGEHKGIPLAFLPRHGKKHQHPPHKVPYRANLWAFKELGVQNVLAPGSVGSLNPKMKPGELVVIDQFFDRTYGRPDTFNEGPKVGHVSAAEPYCPCLRQTAVNTAKKLGISHHPTGTLVVINGPRFSSKAESRYFTNSGFDVVGMTGYPEAILAKELEMCYAGLSLVTDFDAGLEGADGIQPVEFAEVVKTFQDNIDQVQKLIFGIVETASERKDCKCDQAMKNAFIN